MKKSGSQILAEALFREGVKVIFGIPGGSVLPLFDVLFDYPLQLVLTRHEQGAVHAADGYARATGKVGCCLVTSGPGGTNTVTGIATSYMDSIPIVVVTGQVPTGFIGNDAFQEADIVGITRPCTKHSYLIKDVSQIPRVVKEAFYIASTGRPGPVLIDLPKDIMEQKAEPSFNEEIKLMGYKPTIEGHQGQILRASKAIAKAKKPVIYAGGGVILGGASQELREFAELTRTPVTNTLMGLGGFPGTHPLFLGMLGMHGTYSANMAVNESDLLIAIGARFDDRVTGKVSAFATNAQIIHIDIDPTSISKNIRVDIPIVGDVKNILPRLTALLLKMSKNWTSDHQKWLDIIEDWRKRYPLSYSQNEKIKPQFVVEKIYELTRGQAIITTEVGQNQMWAAQFYRFDQPRTFLSSGGLGTMGYGFPAALGAQIAFPDKLVFDIAGDGSFQMNIQELATAVQYRLPVKVAILNNQFLGMVRQWQQMFYNKRYSYSCLQTAPDFVKVAEAYGAVGFRINKPEEVELAIKEAINIPKPVVMDFRVDREENVYPIVPAGAPITNMILNDMILV
ncbi:MAG: biosynthetic-type acetolactate synthase large subunit [Candidatus Tectomicrobia bacterium]|uniref:Acetolactate synthase n=1 Tax=Tectimicrobiota bacterium TaxID=2528274 RepID=A0A933LP91_UNCTE|nr:biosynthetic-type acetolactate synthase large subunit [Candidatus Tectomicrobia bacterium]